MRLFLLRGVGVSSLSEESEASEETERAIFFVRLRAVFFVCLRAVFFVCLRAVFFVRLRAVFFVRLRAVFFVRLRVVEVRCFFGGVCSRAMRLVERGRGLGV